jgi:hypothetical protein
MGLKSEPKRDGHLFPMVVSTPCRCIVKLRKQLRPEREGYTGITIFGPLAELVDALDLGSSIVRCKSSSLLGVTHRGIEQLVAHEAHNLGVVGSSPTPATRNLAEAGSTNLDVTFMPS